MEISVRLTMHNTYKPMHNSSMTSTEAFCELIDNAIDNKATIVNIETTDSYIRITDNGTGIKDTPADIERVLAMAKSSNEYAPNAIGGYGIGLKEASMRLGKGMIIISTAPGCKTISIDLPWRDMDFSKEIRCDVLENGGREQGTEITIYYDEADILEGKSYKKPTVTSFRNYAKLIETGSLTIIYNGVVQEIDEPELKELKDYGKVSNQGFEFELTMGELKENCKAPYGFYIYSKETLRYIKAGSKALDEDTDAIQGLYICIALSSSKKDWRISKNKNEVLNVGVIADSWVFRNALEYWKTKIKKAKSSEMFEEIEDDFSKFMKYGVVTGLQGSRPNKGNDSNSVKPRGSNKKLNVWENVKLNPSGTAQKRSNREQSKIKEIKVRSVHFTNGNIDSLLSIDKSNNIINVNLNSNNKFISELSDNNKPSISKKLVLEQIVGLALGTNDIRGDQLQINLVDLVFIQHEIFRQTERFDNIQI